MGIEDLVKSHKKFGIPVKCDYCKKNILAFQGIRTSDGFNFCNGTCYTRFVREKRR